MEQLLLCTSDTIAWDFLAFVFTQNNSAHDTLNAAFLSLNSFLGRRSNFSLFGSGALLCYTS